MGEVDTTAGISSCFESDECQIFTDVDGVYTTDLNVYKKQKNRKNLFEEMLELSSLGAKVLQIRSVEFASSMKCR